MKNRQRMRVSNQLTIDYLLENGFDDIWLKPHTWLKDYVYTQKLKASKKRYYKATDLWNLFDGIAFIQHKPHYIQIKTNAWAAEKPIKEFLKIHYIDVIVINVTNRLKICKGKYKVFVREYH